VNQVKCAGGAGAANRAGDEANNSQGRGAEHLLIRDFVMAFHVVPNEGQFHLIDLRT
jgi:hypothetical protein